MIPRDGNGRVTVFRWDGATLSVNDRAYSQPDDHQELAWDLLDLVKGPLGLAGDLADEVLRPLTPPWTMLSDALDSWIRIRH